jgi:hypothetical protein
MALRRVLGLTRAQNVDAADPRTRRPDRLRRHEIAPLDALETRSALLYLHASGHHHSAVDAHIAALDDFLTCGELAVDRNHDQPSFVPWRSAAAGAFPGLKTPAPSGIQ